MYNALSAYTSSVDNMNLTYSPKAPITLQRISTELKSLTTQNIQTSKILNSLKIKYSNPVRVDYRYDFPKRFIF
jgi:hypothetical protein